MTSKMDERYEGNFLDALDLPEGAEVGVVIEAVAEPMSEKDSAGKPIKSAILAFQGKQKRLILNKTNFKNLKAMFGRAPKDWIGKRVIIQRRYLDAAHAFGIENTLAIRIIPPKGTPILKSAANFMGQPSPYGQPAKRPPHSPPKQPDHKPPQDDLRQWKDAIAALTSQKSCAEFRDTMLPKEPDALRAQVEMLLAAKESQFLQTGETA